MGLSEKRSDAVTSARASTKVSMDEISPFEAAMCKGVLYSFPIADIFARAPTKNFNDESFLDFTAKCNAVLLPDLVSRSDLAFNNALQAETWPELAA